MGKIFVFSIQSLRSGQMSELIFDEFEGPIISAGRFRTGFHFTFVATFYLPFDKPIETFLKLPTSLTSRLKFQFSNEIFNREFCKHFPELRIRRWLSVRGLSIWVRRVKIERKVCVCEYATMRHIWEWKWSGTLPQELFDRNEI